MCEHQNYRLWHHQVSVELPLSLNVVEAENFPWIILVCYPLGIVQEIYLMTQSIKSSLDKYVEPCKYGRTKNLSMNKS